MSTPLSVLLTGNECPHSKRQKETIETWPKSDEKLQADFPKINDQPGALEAKKKIIEISKPSDGDRGFSTSCLRFLPTELTPYIELNICGRPFPWKCANICRKALVFHKQI